MPRRRNRFVRRIAWLEGSEPIPTLLFAAVVAILAALLSLHVHQLVGAPIVPVVGFLVYVARGRWQGRGKKAKSLASLSRSPWNFEDWLPAWQRGCKQERGRVAQDHVARGPYHSTAHASAQLKTLRGQIASLRCSWGSCVDKPSSDVLLESGMSDLRSVDPSVAAGLSRVRATVRKSRDDEVAETRKAIENACRGLAPDVLASFDQEIEKDAGLTGEWP